MNSMMSIRNRVTAKLISYYFKWSDKITFLITGEGTISLSTYPHNDMPVGWILNLVALLNYCTWFVKPRAWTFYSKRLLQAIGKIMIVGIMKIHNRAKARAGTEAPPRLARHPWPPLILGVMQFSIKHIG